MRKFMIYICTFTNRLAEYSIHNGKTYKIVSCIPSADEEEKFKLFLGSQNVRTMDVT